MNIVESNINRKFVGEFTKGMEVQKAVSRILLDKGIRTGLIRIFGHIENVVLLSDKDGGILNEKRVLNRAGQLLRCEGIISEMDGKFDPVLYTTIGIETEGGMMVLGGVLQEARVLQCEFVLESFDDIFIRKTMNQTGLPSWTDVFTPGESGELTVDESIVSTTSVEVEETEEDEDDSTVPSPGDILNHFKFGKCLVQKVDVTTDIIQVKLPSDRSARLGMQYLTFLLIDESEDGIRVFDVKGKKS
ncbi:MAG: hypothetical protein JXR95_08855 [Deltaproteobacteria bacterium]|nr:hypothetical protein [Deltaproteobacteria bacterium]